MTTYKEAQARQLHPDNESKQYLYVEVDSPDATEGLIFYDDHGKLEGQKITLPVITPPPDCPEGQKWDPVQQICVDDIPEPPPPDPETVKIPIASVVASDDDGNTPEEAIDGDLDTRWSAKGKGEWIELHFDAIYKIKTVKIAFFKGTARQAFVMINNQRFNSSGQSNELQEFIPSSDIINNKLRIVGEGNSSNEWNSITEIQVWGTKTGDNNPTDPLPDNVKETELELQREIEGSEDPGPNPPPPIGDRFDEHGTLMIHETTGNRVEMERGSDHRNGQRFNVNHKFENYMMIGYFKTGKGQEKWEMKTDGPNHSGCDDGDECMWIEPQWNIKDGSFELGGEWPHPDNHDISDSKLTVKGPPTGSIDERWIGAAICVYWNNDKDERTYELWANPDPFKPDGTPNNANWIIGLKAEDKEDNIILPSKNRPRKIPTDFDPKGNNPPRGLEAEIRMHKATNGDTNFKWSYVYELVPE